MPKHHSIYVNADKWEENLSSSGVAKRAGCYIQTHAHYNTTVQGEVKDGKLLNLKVTPESRRKDVPECK